MRSLRSEQQKIYDTIWDDKKILDYFIKPDGTINSVKARLNALDMYAPLKQYLYTRFPDIMPEDSPSEIVYRVANSIETRPSCLVCGKPLPFKTYKLGYANAFCSHECKITDKGKEIEVARYKASCLERHDVDNGAKLESAKEKSKQTCLERYGTEHHTQSDQYKNTMIERYGYVSNLCREDVKQKIAETNNAKYGGPSPFCSEEIRAKLDYDEIVAKGNRTKLENHTFNKSADEEKVNDLLLALGYDVIRQYKSELYKYSCDFYLPEINVYIEVQKSQYHQGRPFTRCASHLKQLEKLKVAQKRIFESTGIEKNQYYNMIDCWTRRDVDKRNTAKKNNIKYLELFIVPGIDTLKALIDKVNDKHLQYAYY